MNEQRSFVIPDNIMETKVKKCDSIDQQESSVRNQGKH